jgi:hypothetical protein
MMILAGQLASVVEAPMRRVRWLSGLIAVLAGLVGVTVAALSGLSTRPLSRMKGTRPETGSSAPRQAERPGTRTPNALNEDVELQPGLLAEYRSLAAGDDPARTRASRPGRSR